MGRRWRESARWRERTHAGSRVQVKNLTRSRGTMASGHYVTPPSSSALRRQSAWKGRDGAAGAGQGAGGGAAGRGGPGGGGRQSGRGGRGGGWRGGRRGRLRPRRGHP